MARRWRFAFALCALLLGTSSARADRVTWRVQAGDMLSALAVRFGVTVEELRTWNGLEGDRILVGQELVVGDGESGDEDDGPTPERVAPTPEPEETSSDEEPRVVATANAARLNRAERARRAQEPTREAEAPTTTSDATSEAPRRDLPSYVLQRGDTLSHVAVRHDTTVAELLAINPGLRPDRVTAGRSIRVPVAEGTMRIEHVVRRGETLGRLAERHRVSVRDLQRWNPGLRRGFRAGRTVVIWSTVPASVSASVGAPNRGRLVDAEPLPQHPGYYVRDASRAYGTLETVLWMQDAVQEVQDRHPRSPRIRVHDVSLREGGYMNGHRSHQSGRDVDISIYQRRCADRLCPMRRMNPDDIDVERTFTLLEHWLKNERLEAVFLDYALQAPLYEEGRRRGYSRAQLSRWFQYPHGPAYPLGVVRHYPRHRDHAHVRFACPDTDDECR
ncbi:MAG: penicillin-insensitive murein endopeptidase [Sandaracinus sp.]|nr:penicillin-insensitive murein endopeptidase [Sandaracinus sp.]MCB9619932.1 penicillin-insensitive murein endopeptidase [Sandaracinus sp.]